MKRDTNESQQNNDLSVKMRIGGKKGLNLNIRSMSVRPNRSLGRVKSLRPNKPAPEAVINQVQQQTDLQQED